MKAFFACPVRGVSEADVAEQRAHVERLEAEGWSVHWPPRDTKQDADGIDICEQNVSAIREAMMIFVAWDGKSRGVLFDLGAAFALRRPITVLGLPPPTREKSFQNMIRAWEAAT